MTPAVSIIMPVYNTEKYLREALDSVLAQTMTDIEVLCVDDGSTDSSLEILHEYAAKDPRVSVFTQDHQFAGAARNLGIKHAVGKYLLFLDSDDVFNPQLAAKTYARAEETEADICVFSGEMFDDISGEHSSQPYFCRTELCPEPVFSAKSRPKEIFLFSSPGPGAKLFRREFITGEGLEFMNLRTCEDVPFVMTAFACAERITLLNEPLILYRQHSASQEHSQDREPTAFYDAFLETQSRLAARGLYKPLKESFIIAAARNCLYNLGTRKTAAGFVKTYSCVRDQAIPEFGLDTLPEGEYSRAGILETKKLSPAAYIALHEPELRQRFYTSGTEDDRLLFDVIAENNGNHEKDIRGILNSPSYKIGRALTAPLHKIRDLLRK